MHSVSWLIGQVELDVAGPERHPGCVCGVFGVWGHSEAAKLTYLGLHGLQHRGQESAGIVAMDESGRSARHLGEGLVADVFSPAEMSRLVGGQAIGHVRYSTTGGSGLQNAQPLTVETLRGSLSLAHNGNLVNAHTIRADLEHQGSIFQAHTDTEVLVHLLARSRAPRMEDRLREALAQVQGAYTLILMHSGGLVGVRDPSGFRPLVLGRLGDAYVLASETSALALIEATFVREIEAGEIISIGAHGLTSERLVHEPDAVARACVFELVYFARPDSQIFERSVYESRYEMGRQLAREATPDADIVIPVPDSGLAAALGFSEESGLPFRHGLIRSHYVGRTFIEPEQSIRHFGVRLKLSAVRAVLENRRIVVIDDSVVRGTTSRKIVGLLRSAGAREVHMRISSPPTRFPCFYGIDTPTTRELIASSNSVDEIRDFITADSLAYLSTKGLHHSVGDGDVGCSGTANPDQTRFCDACFTGAYSSGADTIRQRLEVLQTEAPRGRTHGPKT
ncbi:MAG: amidophosphoribosyltransferase [Deltaproteobacteria bacterium]|nr:amidophosphoribosyltransferase [Deltaproteobacteria bacterium]